MYHLLNLKSLLRPESFCIFLHVRCIRFIEQFVCPCPSIYSFSSSPSYLPYALSLLNESIEILEAQAATAIIAAAKELEGVEKWRNTTVLLMLSTVDLNFHLYKSIS